MDVPRPVFDVYMRTQEQVLNGTTLLSRVAQRLASEPGGAAMEREVSNLFRHYQAGRLEDTQMLSVTYLAPEPEVAARVANMFADEFIKLQFETQQTSRDNARQLLERDLGRVEEQIQVLERELVVYSQHHAVEGARPDRRGLADERLDAISSNTLSAETEVATTTARVESLESASLTNYPETLMTEVLWSRLSALLQLEHELTALRTNFGENWPAVVQKRDEIEGCVSSWIGGENNGARAGSGAGAPGTTDGASQAAIGQGCTGRPGGTGQPAPERFPRVQHPPAQRRDEPEAL